MARRIRCKCCGASRVVNKTSGYIGVDYHKRIKNWRARVTDEFGKTHHLGYFKSEIVAAQVYDDFVMNNHIINRALNFPYRDID